MAQEATPSAEDVGRSEDARQGGLAPGSGGSVTDSSGSTGWSARFEEGLHPFIERFNASIGFDRILLKHDLIGSQAHARMLGTVGVLTSEEAGQLVEALQTIQREAEEGRFHPSLADEDVHFAVERRLIEMAGSLGKKLHTGRSRNDQVSTDLRLWLRDEIDAISGELAAFRSSLLDLADAHLETLIPGYTHLQRAQPLSLAHHLLAYVEMASRDAERLKEVRRRVNHCPLGAAALAGTSVPIDRNSTAHQLGFEALCANSLDAVSDRDFAVEFMTAASLILVHLSRLSEEVVLWASEEFAFAELTDRCATGSSLMPQKKNPDVPELVRGKTGRVFGALLAMLTVLKGLPLAYNKDLQEDKEGLFDAVRTTRDCLQAMTILLREGIRFRPDRLAEAVAADFSNATDVADYLVNKGLPFREAYQLVGRVVKTCLQENCLLGDLPLARWQEFHPFIEADLLERLPPLAVVQARTSLGGTSIDRVREALARHRCA